MAEKRQAPVEVALPAFGVFLVESHHAPGFRMIEQSHPFLELFFVLSGRGTFEIDAASHKHERDDLVVVPPHSQHLIRDDPAEPLSLYAVCVADAVVQHEPALFDRLPRGRVRIGHTLAGELRDSFRRLLFEQTRRLPFAPTLIVGLTLQLLAAAARESVSQPPSPATASQAAAGRRALVERYVQALNQRFFERSSLDDAAAELGISRRRFTALFSEVTGRSWADHVTELRMAYARKLLAETRRSVISIAFECGFEDLSSFYRTFKRSTGVSPGQWRSGREA